eukprot:1156076-Pelagomonas_calceolata.AAC.4
MQYALCTASEEASCKQHFLGECEQGGNELMATQSTSLLPSHTRLVVTSGIEGLLVGSDSDLPPALPVCLSSSDLRM